MKRIATLLTFAILLSSTSVVNAQNLKKLIPKKKENTEEVASDTTENKEHKGFNKFKTDLKKGFGEILGEEETEETVEVKKEEKEVETTAPKTTTTKKKEEKIDYTNSESVADQGLKGIMGKMNIGPKDANIKDAYSYTGYIEMTIKSYEGSRLDETVVYKTYLDSKTTDYCMEFTDPDEGNTTYMIYDTENSQMITLGEEDGEKTGFAIKFDPEQMAALASEYEDEDEDEVEDTYKIYKTGNKKKILGYTCEEHIIKDENSKVTMWITDDVIKGSRNNYMNNSMIRANMAYAGAAQGMVLEYIVIDYAEEEMTEMTVTDLDLNHNHSIKTSSYEVIEMGTGQGVLY